MMDGPLPADLIPAWEQLFSRPEQLTLDPDSGVCEAVFSDGVVFPLQRKREMVRMLSIARDISPATVFEIGVDKLGSVAHWCLLPTVRRVVACEIRGTPAASLFERAFPHIEFMWLPCSSYDPRTVSRVSHWLDHSWIDCMFLDGEKARYLADFDAYLPLMNPAGVVFFHDVNDRAPVDAYRSVCKRGYRHEEVIDTRESEEALRRAAEGFPEASSHEGWVRHWRGRSAGVGVIWLGKGRA